VCYANTKPSAARGHCWAAGRRPENAPVAASRGDGAADGVIRRMSVELVPIGFNNVVAMSRVLVILVPDSQPVRRMVQEARKVDRVIDATLGRRTKAVLVLDSGHLVLAALQPETIVGRFDQRRGADRA